MAFFDIPSPLFQLLDGLLEPFTNELMRISIWALMAALVTSLIFKKLSNPVTISALKTQLKAKQKQLNAHDGEFSELKSLAIETMKLSLKRMGLTFMPAMLASIPVVFVLAYLSNQYALQTPLAGETVPIKLIWEEQNSDTLVSIKTDTQTSQLQNITSIKWPKTDQVTELLDTNDNLIVAFPLPISTVVHKKQWWNSLIGNPAGYLADASAVNRIDLEFQQQKIIHSGPQWMHGWLFVFFFMTLAFSVIFLFIFKIKF